MSLLKHPAILWVEDDPYYMNIIQAVFRADYSRYRLVAAQDGREALDYLEDAVRMRDLPCLIVLDINMPMLDGRATLQYLIRNPKLKGIKKVFFSNSQSSLDRFFSYHYGVPLLFKAPGAEACSDGIRTIIQELAAPVQQPS